MKKIHAYRGEQNKKSFAYGMNFYKLIWIFVIGCIMGYVIETIWCFINFGYIESRKGLIYGPFSPVYGFGAVVFTLLLNRFFDKNGVLIFLLSGACGAIFEYLCSWAQQILVGSISWEYSDKPFNLGGRTSLQYAFFWGLLGYFFIRYIYPFVSTWIEKIPNNSGKVLTWVISIFMIFDITVSSAAVKRQTLRNQGVEATTYIEKFIDSHYTDEFLKQIYPNMVTVVQN